MSKYSCFDLSVTNHIAQVTLSRGDELNTMNRSFWKELSHIMDEINRNSEVRVVIMSSTGKHFCAGMDLDAFSHGVDNIPNDKKPDHLTTVFAGVDRDAVEKVRYYLAPVPPSSPAIALFKDGELVHMLERHHIEGRPAELIAENLKEAYNQHC